MLTLGSHFKVFLYLMKSERLLKNKILEQKMAATEKEFLGHYDSISGLREVLG